MEKVTGHPNFFLLATMNPGGDYGKKELSPALRNRFTEVWVPPVRDKEELIKIASGRYTYFHFAPINLSFLFNIYYIVDEAVLIGCWIIKQVHKI